MNINLTDLYTKGYLEINDECVFSKEEIEKANLLDLKEVYAKGNISKNSLDEYEINIIVEGIMTLPCAVSLKPVDYKFTSEINENLAEIMEKSPKKSENNQKTIDILPIIWENILMEIPIRVVSDDLDDIKTKGDGWELITDEEEKVNPSLAKLKDLL